MFLQALLCSLLLQSSGAGQASPEQEECDAANLLSTSLHVHRAEAMQATQQVRLSCANGDFESRMQMLKASFESDGIMISAIAGSSFPTAAKEHTSATVLRKDFPFTIYLGNIGKFGYPYDSFKHGIVFQPFGCSNTPTAECTFTNDGFTTERHPACNTSFTYPVTSGKCKFATAAEYTEYYLTSPGSESVYMYGKGLCYFDALDQALDAQVAFYDGMAASTTFKFPGPPMYDEVIVGKYPQDGLLGVFWAHDGGFVDDPAKVKELGGCFTVQILRKCNYTLPVFEFANMDWPGKKWSDPELYRGYLDGMVARNKVGGYKASDVMRLVDSSMFKSSLYADC